MIGYKKVVEGLVEKEVTNYVEERTTGKFCFLKDNTLVLSLEHKELGFPTFTVEVSVKGRDFVISGYISNWGNVSVASVEFDRKEGNTFLHGVELDDFHFDR